MRLAFRVIALVFLFAVVSYAQAVKPVHVTPARSVTGHVWGYLTHHKEVIAQSLLWDAAIWADAESSIRCQEYPGCYETNSVLGAHPHASSDIHYALLGSIGVDVPLFVAHWAGGSTGVDGTVRHVWWVPILAYDGLQVQNVWSNANIAESLSNQPKQQSTAEWLRRSGIRK